MADIHDFCWTVASYGQGGAGSGAGVCFRRTGHSGQHSSGAAQWAGGAGKVPQGQRHLCARPMTPLP